MASLAGLENIALPGLNSMDAADARALRNYLYQLTEQLSYVLTNLDEENLSGELWNRLEKKGE